MNHIVKDALYFVGLVAVSFAAGASGWLAAERYAPPAVRAWIEQRDPGRTAPEILHVNEHESVTRFVTNLNGKRVDCVLYKNAYLKTASLSC